MTVAEEQLVAEVRRAARGGCAGSGLVRLIRERSGVCGAGEGRLVVGRVLRQAFKIPISVLADVSTWKGFEDSDAHLSDAEVDALLEAFLGAEEEEPSSKKKLSPSESSE